MQSTNKVIHFDKNRSREDTMANNLCLKEGDVIDRRDFGFWIQLPKAAKQPFGTFQVEEINYMVQSLSERVSVLKCSLENGRKQEVVALSARISVIASQLSLPRTAELASQIGEAQMNGDDERVAKVVAKLDDLIESLFHDISC